MAGLLRPWTTDTAGSGTAAGGGRVGTSNVAYRLLCKCSYKVRCEIMRHGEQLGELTFFDDEETSVTQGERVWHCPGCRSRLGFLSLRS